MDAPKNNSRYTDEIMQIRRKRIGQTIAVMLFVVSALALVNLLDTRTIVAPILIFTMVFLTVSLVVLRRGHLQAAAMLTAFVIFVAIAHAMWSGHGLRSSSLIAYPAALLFILIMLGRRAFYVATGGMLIYMAVILTANQMGWRTGLEEMQSYRWLIDYGILLVGAAFIVRVLATDLLALLDALRHEVAEVTKSRLAAEHLANHDNLTGLPNRRMAELYFEQILSQCRKSGAGMALIFVDVDNFKLVNDTHGHQCGDDLLRHISTAVRSGLRRSDRFTRIAGDEFLILLPGVRDTKDIDKILRKVKRCVNSPVTISGVVLSPALSMGVAMAPHHGENFQTVLMKADQALYQAKAAGRNQYQFYQSEPGSIPLKISA